MYEAATHDQHAELVGRAQRLADEALFPAAVQADAAGHVPVASLDLIAEAGFYGLTSTDPEHGLRAAPATVCAVIEAVASGCLTTAFVWTQHLSPAAAAAQTEGPVANEWGTLLASGSRRAGVAFAHILRPDPPLTQATPHAEGWVFSGTAPWVTGWGHIDVVHAAARYGDQIVWALLDATETPTLAAAPLRLAAVNSSATVTLTYTDTVVPADRVTKVESFADWKARYGTGLRTNGSLALGVARRCCALLESTRFDRQLVETRERLDTSDQAEMPAARAAASAFAVQAAAALVAATGGRAITLDEHAQRLAREALFLLVQGQTPAIKQHLIDEFAGRALSS